MATIKTAAQLRAELKKNGVRLPHGYDVVKRASKKKKATTAKAKTAPKKTATKAKRKPSTTAKQSQAQRKFAANAKRAAQLVKTGKAKNTAAAWKQIKMDF